MNIIDISPYETQQQSNIKHVFPQEQQDSLSRIRLRGSLKVLR